MKKIALSMVAIAAISITSCGAGAESKDIKEEVEKDPICECFEAEAAMKKEMKAAAGDEATIKEINDRFKSQKETCREIGKAMKDGMKDLKPEEMKKKREELAESCPAAKEAMGL
jgi:hypothetical protein